MQLKDVDSNFIMEKLDVDDVEWYDAKANVFTLKGGYYCQEEGRYRRIPKEVMLQTTENLEYLATQTAGLVLKFKTNSPFIAVRATLPNVKMAMNLTSMMVYGFTLFVGEDYESCLVPEFVSYPKEDTTATVSFEAIRRLILRRSEEMTLYFPMMNGCISLEIGIQKGATLQKIQDKNEKPLVFYGSSITNGACASQPGNHYATLLAKALEKDVLNFGFSGNARGEKPIIDYIAEKDASAFIIEYDFNASVEGLRETHLNVYKTIRAKHPKTPIVMFSRAAFEYNVESAERRQIVRDTYEYAKARGDEFVEFIDGETFYGQEDRFVCSQDTCHPNDIGFYRMYKKILPKLQKYIQK